MLVETLILNEGQVEDLLAANPQLQPAVDAGIKKPDQLKWLLSRQTLEPIADMVGLILAFEKNKQLLATKELSTDLNSYKHPNDLRTALETAGESKGEQRRQLKDNETDIVYQDEQWLVVMPHTRESSIHWGKGTTWCTAATQSANLFYSYVGRKDEDIILFYVIKKDADSKVDPNAKLSVGFVNDQPVLGGEEGGLTVNALNDGLTEASLEAILGSEFKLIMSAMKSHSGKIGGKHPAKVAIQKIAASKDPSLLDKYTLGMDEEQRSDFINILFQYELSPEILTLLASDKDAVIRRAVAQNPSTPKEVLTLLARDKDKNVRSYVAINSTVSAELLSLLARDKDKNVRAVIAQNPKISTELLSLLASDKDKTVKVRVAYNPNTPTELLTLLASDEDRDVRRAITLNSKTSPEVLSLLARDKDEIVRSTAAINPTYQKYLESQTQLTERWLRLSGLLN